MKELIEMYWLIALIMKLPCRVESWIWEAWWDFNEEGRIGRFGEIANKIKIRF